MKSFNFIKTATAVLMIAALSILTASAIGIQEIAPLMFIGGTAISLFVNFGDQTGMAFTALNITDLNTALGAYYRKNKDVLISEMLLGLNLEDRFEVMDDVKDEVPLPSLEIADIVKPANDTTFQPTSNALTFDARILKVRRWKVDLQLIPFALEKSWLGAYKKKGSDAYDMPFEQYIFDYIIKKIHNNVRMSALYGGTYNGAGTTPVDIMDGLKKIIADEITATNITPVVTGIITEANVVTNLLATYDALGDAYKNIPVIGVVSNQLFDWYARKLNPVSNTALLAADSQIIAAAGYNNAMPLYGTNAVLVREPGMGSSQRIIMTPKENMVYGTDSLGEENNIKIQEFERTLKLMIDAKSGVQFKEIHARALAVNDQA